MSKLPIKDPRIRVAPSKALETFLKTHLSREPNLPEGIENLCKKKSGIGGNSDRGLQKGSVEFTTEEKSFLRETNSKLIEEINLDAVTAPDEKTFQDDDSTTQLLRDESPILLLDDLKWINAALNRLRTKKDIPHVPYLHEFMHECTMILPENEQLERNAELEARCQMLRKEQEAREYEAMTRNVDNVRTHLPQDTIAFQSTNCIFWSLSCF